MIFQKMCKISKKYEQGWSSQDRYCDLFQVLSFCEILFKHGFYLLPFILSAFQCTNYLLLD